MKKLFFLFVIILLAVGVVMYRKPLVSTAIPTGVAVQKSLISPTIGVQAVTIQESKSVTPRRLIISKLHVDAAIESVGMDSKGNMDVPKDSDNAAWYNLGYKPGENGSAVIDGHFDKQSGAPAVFYELGSLNSGDTIQIEQSDGKRLTFEVTKSDMYAYDKLPLQEIFNTSGKPVLNLITCNGTFDTSAKNYSKRLVVQAVLQ